MPAAKKSRKEIYEKKHKPQQLNPLGLTEEEVLKRLNDGTIVTGAPPPKRRCKSAQWEMGIKFLFDAETNEEITNWFYCEKCTWLQNVQLGGGTGNLLHHARNHKEQPYKFTRDELSDLLKKAVECANSTGATPDFERILPEPEDWYLD